MSKLIYKAIKYTLFFCLGLLVFLFVGSFVAGYFMGRDIKTLNLDKVKVSAARDPEGVWELEVPNREALWYSFGFLQAHDRYFQLELIRHAALGRLAELMGEEALGRDRLARAMSAVAYKEFSAKEKDSDLVRSAQNFVDGLRDWQKSDHVSNPVEFKVLGLGVEQMPAWEPWHIYAISYYQAWLFSYDLFDELREAELVRLQGQKWVKFFDGREINLPGTSLYEQASIVKQLKKPKSGLEVARYQKIAQVSREAEALNAIYGLPREGQKTAKFGRIPNEAKLGASNAWVGYVPDRKKGPILCNDPHLNLMWPSSLYPIKYELKDLQLKSAGWMLPGQPFLVMGGLENKTRSYAWGITLANYANVQDRIVLSEGEIKAASDYRSVFKVRNPQNFQTRTVHFDEKWTSRGPVASEWFDRGEDLKESDRRPWALDWIGFRGTEPPYAYFISQNYHPELNTSEAIAKEWQTPSVNLHWVSKDKVADRSSWGHMATGLIFGGPASGVSRKMLAPQDRPFYEADSTMPKTSFLASANQQIWNPSISAPLARHWGAPLRASRILDKETENFNTQGFSQLDDHSPLAMSFVKWARRRLHVGRLCSEGAADLRARCEVDLAALDAWNGSMSRDGWQASLVSLWLSHLHWKFWIHKNASLAKSDLTSRSDREIRAFVQWARSGAAQRVVWQAVTEASFSAALQKNFGLDLDAMVEAAFTESYLMLERSMGPDRKIWQWGNLHRVAWQHPMLRVLGPNLPFVGPPVGGADDSPQRASHEWDPRYPLLFPVVHGAVQRSCYDLSGDKIKMQWTAVSGPSGNPFSRWSQTFAKEYYFASKWVEENFFIR